jgi:8-oxo-dGTP pyrophosphatase MutT (NUDIX family)
MCLNGRRKNNKWGFPGGGIERRDKTAWDAAKREFKEETGHTFKDAYFTDVKQFYNHDKTTMTYIGYYNPPGVWKIKSNFKSKKEIDFVEFPRWINFLESLKTGGKLKCGKHDQFLRKCMKPGTLASPKTYNTVFRNYL